VVLLTIWHFHAGISCPPAGCHLAGVNLPDTIQVRGTPLVLNGMGLRTKCMVNAGLSNRSQRAPTRSSNPTQQKRIVMQFLHGASKSQMADTFNASFNYNPQDARNAMKADVDRLLNQLDSSPAIRWFSVIFRARSSFSMAAKT
jgi:hypothetical protein